MGPMGHPFLEVGTEFHSASGHKGRVQGAGKGSKRDSGGFPALPSPAQLCRHPREGNFAAHSSGPMSAPGLCCGHGNSRL